VLIIGIVCGVIFFAAMRLEAESEAEQVDRLRDAIRRAAIQCYALEGAFPSNVHHLQNYGVILDETRFIIHYNLSGIGNYMPEIYVFLR
jgi:hypothetical protein